MKQGFGAVKESIERAKGSFDNTGFLNYFGWKDGDKKVIRFITDEVITANWYDFVVTRDGKNAGSFPLATEVGWDEDYVLKYGGLNKGDNGLEPARAREKTVGIAVLREEVPVNKDGRVTQSVADHFEEIEISGKKYQSRSFGIVSQSYRNFWAPIVGYFSRYGTICDRDYEITRVGADQTTQYTIIPVDPIDGLRDVEDVQKAYGYGTTHPSDDNERFLYCPKTLPEWIKEQAAEDWIKSRLATSEGVSQSSSGSSEFKNEGPPPDFIQTSQVTDSHQNLRAALINNK